jgi:hypothetical protein
MDTRQWTGLVTYSARYFFNIDEHLLMQFVTVLFISAVVYLQEARNLVQGIAEIARSAKNYFVRKIKTVFHENLIIHHSRF